MLTPQEVSEHAFAKASFGGYNMAMVDEFLDVLTADYTTLYKENATLKAKMKVLVDKVEEYRSTEEAMRKALLTAQKMADELVAQAEAKKAELLKNAETEAKARIAELQQDIRSEQMRLTAAQNATAAYVGKRAGQAYLFEGGTEWLQNLVKAGVEGAAKGKDFGGILSDIGEAAKQLEDFILGGLMGSSIGGVHAHREVGGERARQRLLDSITKPPRLKRSWRPARKR